MIHYLVTAIIDFAIGLIALRKGSNKAIKALSLASFSLGLWSLELYFLTVINDLDLLSILFHVTRWGMFFIPPTVALLTWRIAGSRASMFTNIVVIPSFFVAACLSLGNTFLFPSILEPAAGGFLPKPDNTYNAFAALFIYSLVSSVIYCFLCYRNVTTREKQRIKWLLITLVCTFASGYGSILLMTSGVFLKLIGPITNLLFLSLLFYATAQHHLMDIRSAISVGLTRAILFISVVWVYFFLDSITQHLDDTSTTRTLVMFLFIALALEAYPRAIRKLMPNAKRLLSKTKFDLENLINQTKISFNETTNVSALKHVLEYLFSNLPRVELFRLAIKDKNGFFFINDKTYMQENSWRELLDYFSKATGLVICDETPKHIQSILQSYNANAAFCINHKNDVHGLFFIGSKKDGSYYLYDEIKLFQWLESELGGVINRINKVIEMQEQLGDAKKTLSMLSFMNHYHHDIKAPLAIIDGVLSNDLLDKEKQRDIVLEQVARGTKLIATMASILKGERKRKIQSLSIHEIARECLYLFQRRFDKINLSLDETPPIVGDAEDLKILIINTIKNALEAKDNNKSLELGIRSWSDDAHVYLSIKDSGIGMNEDTLSNLWSENLPSSKSGGTAIGLQAIKRIADEHYAMIEVSSKPSFGSEFLYKFPIYTLTNNKPNEIKSNIEPIFKKVSEK